MTHIIHFGEKVEGYDIPVLNEREIRASAGILFLGALFSLILILFNNNFLLAKYFITAFLVDLIIRVFINPAFSPSLIIGRLIVRNQVPEYVGAKQKKFAWMIGIVLSGMMFIFLVIINAYGPITGVTCLICLIFLFFESAFGICLGCKFYSIFYKGTAQYCPGEICDRHSKQDIQKTSFLQLLIVIVFITSIIVTVSLSIDYYSVKPHAFFGHTNSAVSK